MQIIVEAKSKFGVLHNGTWFNPKDKSMLSQFKVGGAYEVDVEEVEKNGKKYKNMVKIVPINVDAVSPAKKEAFAKVNDNKDRRILFQGLTQAVVQSNLVTGVDDVEPVVTKLAEMVDRLAN